MHLFVQMSPHLIPNQSVLVGTTAPEGEEEGVMAFAAGSEDQHSAIGEEYLQYEHHHHH